MKAEDKKAAITAYKERKIFPGIFALRCRPSGQLWVGKASDLGTIQNRLWFTLQQGTHPNQSLQVEWKAHGAENFDLEELERLEDEKLAYILQASLKDRLAYWQDKLMAAGI